MLANWYKLSMNLFPKAKCSALGHCTQSLFNVPFILPHVRCTGRRTVQWKRKPQNQGRVRAENHISVFDFIGWPVNILLAFYGCGETGMSGVKLCSECYEWMLYPPSSKVLEMSVGFFLNIILNNIEGILCPGSPPVNCPSPLCLRFSATVTITGPGS